MVSRSILSDITVYSKYAKHIGTRRETWEEIVGRTAEMHARKFPELEDKIYEVFATLVVPKKIVPSMRSLQFAGKPIDLSPNRLFNCAYTAIDDYRAFSEIMFLLLGGSGVGFSVQARHISQLPPIQHPRGERRYVVQDNIIGWSEAIRTLMKAYFFGRPKPRYIFDDIREKGMRLITSGGKAPGPIPLKECLYAIENILFSKRIGEKLNSTEVFDITTYIAEAVLVGGIRRSATIALFDPWDYEMLTAKSGDWYATKANRAMANISAVLDRRTTTKGEFEKVFKMTKASGSGEPGFVWTNDPDMGVNPCAEISLPSKSLCNLTECYLGDNPSHEEMLKRVAGATFIGTLQASYTDFFYLRPEWSRNVTRDALLGVSLTGIASLPNNNTLDFSVLGTHAQQENKFWADKIGINPAKRVTCVGIIWRLIIVR